MTAVGIRCQVAAPSKLIRPPGDRVKTDGHGALHLARLLRLDEITAVAVPTLGQETARDLVRARADVRKDLMGARHRLSTLLLRHGLVYSGGDAWTGRHDAWLRSLRFDQRASRVTFEEGYDAVLTAAARRDRSDAEIEAMAADSEYTPLVRRLGCLRAVATVTGFALAVEIGDWHRFTGRSIGSFLGLVPSEQSSGSSRSQGPITKGRQQPRPAAAGRGRLAPPAPIPRRQDPARPVGAGTSRRPGPRRPGQPPAPRPLGEVRAPGETQRHRRRRDRPRAGRMVLVPGGHGLTNIPLSSRRPHPDAGWAACGAKPATVL